LRGKEGVANLDQSNGDYSNEILELATEFSQSIAASLDLNTTVNSILNNVGKLVPSDVLELKIWDADRKTLTPHRNRLTNTGKLGVTGSLSKSQFGSLTEKIATDRSPLMIENVQQSELINGELVSVQSYLGIPLLA